MKRFLLFLFLLTVSSNISEAYRRPIVIQNGGTVGDHIEHYAPADMPDVFFDNDTQEIIIEADGFASYYDVDIFQNGYSTPIISTQVDGYGDTIDVSSLPDGDYTIVISTPYNNVYEGYFSNY